MKTSTNSTMKTLMTIFFATFIFASANAFTKADAKLSRLTTANNSINLYIETITKGNIENIDELFDSQFVQNTNANGKLISHNKEQVIQFIKGQKNIQQNCSATYSMMEQSENYSLAKVEMKYHDFTKVDYITLSKIGTSWKVNQVVTTYK